MAKPKATVKEITAALRKTHRRLFEIAGGDETTDGEISSLVEREIRGELLLGKDTARAVLNQSVNAWKAEGKASCPYCGGSECDAALPF